MRLVATKKKTEKSAKPEAPQMPFATQKAWRAWLEKNHDRLQGVWMQLARVNSGVPSVTYAEALDVALCFGWIDGQKKGLDDTAWLQKFTPRGAKSIWSKVNREKIAALTSAVRCTPPGRPRWKRPGKTAVGTAPMTPQRTPQCRRTLRRSWKRHPAKAFFETLKSANRYAILWRLKTAKKPETRQRRLEMIIGMLKRGETFH